MSRCSTAPLQLEILSVRFMDLPATDYVVEVATDGIRLRKKGTAKWLGPASWESILSAAARSTMRRVETDSEARRHA